MVPAYPVTRLHDARFQLRPDGQRQQVTTWLASAGVARPQAEVAHLEAVLLDVAAYLVVPEAGSERRTEGPLSDRNHGEASSAVAGEPAPDRARSSLGRRRSRNPR